MRQEHSVDEFFFQTFCNQNGIDLWMAPGEAHWKLGVVERRHPVLHRAIELYLQDTHLPPARASIIQAVENIIPAMNTLSFTKGYTPSQWVIGTNPTEKTSILSDSFNPATL